MTGALLRNVAGKSHVDEAAQQVEVTLPQCAKSTFALAGQRHQSKHRLCSTVVAPQNGGCDLLLRLVGGQAEKRVAVLMCPARFRRAS